MEQLVAREQKNDAESKVVSSSASRPNEHCLVEEDSQARKSLPVGPIIQQGPSAREQRPPKSLVLIWVVMAGELVLDLATTIVALGSLLASDQCCGYPINLGPVPMIITVPFFFLVATELAFLVLAIFLTLFPTFFDLQRAEQYDADGKVIMHRNFLRRCLCCFGRLKMNMIMRVLGLMVLLNPFFGCGIAWILLYHSDEKKVFLVLGLEGGSLCLHYIAVRLERAITSLWTLFLHGLVPLIPFCVAIGMTMIYLKQGGVCYSVEDAMFMLNGCDVCLNGYPPVDGLCHSQNGTSYLFSDQEVILGLADVKSIDDSAASTKQRTYCAGENPDGPDVNFCFFDFEEGELDVQAIANNGTVSN
jgi:hypothetical protein